MKLSEWSRLDPKDRALLVETPCETSSEIESFQNILNDLVIKACGTAPSPFIVPDETPLWEMKQIPAQVLEKAESFAIDLQNETWNHLTALQRFALVKLSRPGHEGKNFQPALEEFGLIKI